MKQDTCTRSAHIFICTNDRKGKRKSCADFNSLQFKTVLKQYIKDKGWSSQIKVSSAGCLGYCTAGPNIIIYPHKIHFSEVKLENMNKIKKAIDELMLNKRKNQGN